MRGYRPRRAVPDKQESALSASNRLLMLLGACTDEALALLTPEKLAATHRVPLEKCRDLLEAERAQRDGMVWF